MTTTNLHDLSLAKLEVLLAEALATLAEAQARKDRAYGPQMITADWDSYDIHVSREQAHRRWSRARDEVAKVRDAIALLGELS